jgi:drug/metabolite transporter (DMT)-like permease
MEARMSMLEDMFKSGGLLGIAVALGAAVLGERLGASSMAGAALVLLGVALLARDGSRGPVKTSPSI